MLMISWVGGGGGAAAHPRHGGRLGALREHRVHHQPLQTGTVADHIISINCPFIDNLLFL